MPARKNSTVFSIDQLVWVKIRGCACWPAKIYSIRNAARSKKVYKVSFIADARQAEVDESALWDFRSHYETFAKEKPKKLQEAIREATRLDNCRRLTLNTKTESIKLSFSSQESIGIPNEDKTHLIEKTKSRKKHSSRRKRSKTSDLPIVPQTSSQDAADNEPLQKTLSLNKAIPLTNRSRHPKKEFFPNNAQNSPEYDRISTPLKLSVQKVANLTPRTSSEPRLKRAEFVFDTPAKKNKLDFIKQENKLNTQLLFNIQGDCHFCLEGIGALNTSNPLNPLDPCFKQLRLPVNVQEREYLMIDSDEPKPRKQLKIEASANNLMIAAEERQQKIVTIGKILMEKWKLSHIEAFILTSLIEEEILSAFGEELQKYNLGFQLFLYWIQENGVIIDKVINSITEGERAIKSTHEFFGINCQTRENLLLLLRSETNFYKKLIDVSMNQVQGLVAYLANMVKNHIQPGCSQWTTIRQQR